MQNLWFRCTDIYSQVMQVTRSLGRKKPRPTGIFRPEVPGMGVGQAAWFTALSNMALVRLGTERLMVLRASYACTYQVDIIYYTC